MKKIMIIALTVLVLFLAWGYWSLDGFKNIRPHQNWACTPINGTGSVEDIAMDAQHQWLFLSVYDRLGLLQGDNKGNGAIVSFELDGVKQTFTASSEMGLADFRPAGLSLYTRANGQRRLYVVNNRSTGQDTVEAFIVDSAGELIFEKTIKNDAFKNATDINVVGYDQFYLTTGVNALSAFDRFFAMLGLTHSSNLIYVDRNAVISVVADQSLLTSVAGSADNRYIYVSNAAARSIDLYQRDLLSGELMQVQSLDLPAAPEQITRADNNELWVAATPKPLSLIYHVYSDGKKSSASEILKLTLEGDRLTFVSQMNSLGFDQSATSVATKINNHVILGSFTARNILKCKG